MALLPQDPKDQKLFAAALLAGVLVFGYHHFVRAPRTAETESLRTQLSGLETRNATARTIADQQGGPALVARVESLEQHMGLLEALVPRKEEVPLLLREISLHARDTRLQLTRLKPELEEAGEHYVKRTYELNVQGPYHAIGAFLAQVGSLSRIMTPIQLKLMPDGVKRTRDGAPLVNANFRLLTYIVPPNGEAPADHVASGVVGAAPPPTGVPDAPPVALTPAAADSATAAGTGSTEGEQGGASETGEGASGIAQGASRPTPAPVPDSTGTVRASVQGTGSAS